MAVRKFEKYDAGELEAVGKAFCSSIKQDPEFFQKLGTEQWTEFVLDWFAETAARGRRVDTRSPCTRQSWRGAGAIPDGLPQQREAVYGEFLVDLAHTSYPAYDSTGLTRQYGTQEYWEDACKQQLRMDLALESEWGDSRSLPASIAEVMEDAAKLAALKASAKVMLLASPNGNDRGVFLELLSGLRDAWGDDKVPWLWIDVPWRPGPKWPGPSCGLLNGN